MKKTIKYLFLAVFLVSLGFVSMMLLSLRAKNSQPEETAAAISNENTPSGKVLAIKGKYDFSPVPIGSIAPAGFKIINTTLNGNDQGMVFEAEQFDLGDPRGRGHRRRTPLDDDVKAARAQLPEGSHERRRLLVGDLDAEHAGELAGEVRHPALQPVAPVGGNDLRYGIHDPGVVRADEREDKVDHGCIVARRPRRAQAPEAPARSRPAGRGRVRPGEGRQPRSFQRQRPPRPGPVLGEVRPSVPRPFDIVPSPGSRQDPGALERE